MSANHRDDPAFDTDLMIDSADGLRSIAEKIEREGNAALDQSDMREFLGSFQAGPVLSALGIEIALKAWIYRETNCKRLRGHDLLCLFERLDRKTQELLEDAWQRGRGTGTADDPIRELAVPKRIREAKTVKDLICPRLSHLSEVLEEHRMVFVNWRYMHENPCEQPHPGVLDKVLTVLIDTYRNTSRTDRGL